MTWNKMILRQQLEILDRLEKTLSEEALTFLDDVIRDIKEGARLGITRLIDSRKYLFPGDSVFGALALLHHANAAKAGARNDLDWLVYSLNAGTWAAAIFLGSDAIKEAIQNLEPLATQYLAVQEERSQGGRNSHGMTFEERQARNNEIRALFTEMVNNGKSKQTAYRTLGKKYKLNPATIKTIVKG